MHDVLKQNYLFTPAHIIAPSSLVHGKVQVATKRNSMVHALGHDIQFSIHNSGGILQICGRIAVPENWSYTANPLIPEWYLKDHIVLFFSPHNQFHIRRQIAFTAKGELFFDDAYVFDGEEYSDTLSKAIDLPTITPELSVTTDDDGSWSFRIEIKLKELLGTTLDVTNSATLDATTIDTTDHPSLSETPLGFMIAAGIESELEHPSIKWPAAANDYPWSNSPFCFGQIIAPDTVCDISAIHVPHPVWAAGNIRSSLTLTGTQNKRTEAQRDICAEIIITGSDGSISTTTTMHTLTENFSIEMPLTLPFSSKWAPDIADTATVCIRLLADTQLLWSATLPFGFDCGIIPREPYAACRIANIARPSPQDPDFINNYRTWILSKIPNWSYQTTLDGAPSDFFLKGTGNDDRDSFNLMDSDIFSQFANYIHEHFTDWQDALYAVAVLLHHPYLTRHSKSWSATSAYSTPETVLRQRGCLCCDTSRLGAKLTELLAPLYDISLTAYTLGLRGHLLTLVDTLNGQVLIDPMLGVSWFSQDHTRLATLEEIKQSLRLQKEAWAQASYGDREYLHNNNIMRISPWKKNHMLYP